MEEVPGIKYGEFIQKYIFDPLDVKRSGWLPYSSDIDNVAIGYQSPRFGPPSERKLLFSSFGAGNIYSAAADLCKWDDALYTESRLLILMLCNTDGCKESNNKLSLKKDMKRNEYN